MSLLSRLFGATPQRTYVSPALGVFTLVYSKGPDHRWSANKEGIVFSCKGTTEAPYPEQVKFLEEALPEIDGLAPAINEKFRELFEEADLDVNFSTWSDRFELAAVEVSAASGGTDQWIISFQDSEAGHAHFNLLVEHGMPQDFSIDT